MTITEALAVSSFENAERASGGQKRTESGGEVHWQL